MDLRGHRHVDAGGIERGPFSEFLLHKHNPVFLICDVVKEHTGFISTYIAYCSHYYDKNLFIISHFKCLNTGMVGVLRCEGGNRRVQRGAKQTLTC